MDPYALGLLLGDGCVTGRDHAGLHDHRSRARGGDAGGPRQRAAAGRRHVEVGHRLRAAPPGRRARRPPRLANPVTAILRELGLAGHARRRRSSCRASTCSTPPEVRLAVLQGLLDTDGGPVTQRGRTCRVQYTTTSPRLRDDVIFLVRSLGGVAYCRTRPAEGRTPGLAQRSAGAPPPRRPRRRHPPPRGMRAVPPRPQARGLPTPPAAAGRCGFIDRIEPVGEAETVCIQVAAADSLYVTDDFLLTHNTLNDAFIILDEAQNTTPEQMKMFLTRLGFGSKMVVTGDVTQVDLPGRHAAACGSSATSSTELEDVALRRAHRRRRRPAPAGRRHRRRLRRTTGTQSPAAPAAAARR